MKYINLETGQVEILVNFTEIPVNYRLATQEEIEKQERIGE